MAKFITGNELNHELEKLFENAANELVLISPYIKLHERFISVLKTKKEDPLFYIGIVFGKNEDDITRSMKKEDFNFFKEFPNIEIRYEKRLHAKYYGNENSAIITSMNLYSYSQDNNIESGVLTKRSLLGNIAGKITGEDTLDTQAAVYFQRVIDQSELLFTTTPQFEDSLFGLKKKYIGSKVEVDELSDFFSTSSNYDKFSRKQSFENVKKEVRAQIPQERNGDRFQTPSERNEVKVQPGQPKNGFCIRTGKPMVFNDKRPMCDEAFQSWSKFGNKDYPEKYCHFSGEPSNGETSFSKPILKRNWSKAKQTFGL